MLEVYYRTSPGSFLLWTYDQLTSWDQRQVDQHNCQQDCQQDFATQSRVALFDLGNSVDEKIARLKINSSIETEWFRQTKYLNWCQIKKIPDACGNEYGYKRILACFIENLIIDCHFVQPLLLATCRPSTSFLS